MSESHSLRKERRDGKVRINRLENQAPTCDTAGVLRGSRAAKMPSEEEALGLSCNARPSGVCRKVVVKI